LGIFDPKFRVKGQVKNFQKVYRVEAHKITFLKNRRKRHINDEVMAENPSKWLENLKNPKNLKFFFKNRRCTTRGLSLKKNF